MAAKNMLEIAEYIKTMRFRKRIIGGIDEADVWKQLADLHKEYQSAFDVQAKVSEVLLAEKEQEILRLKRQISKLKSGRGEKHE